MTIKQKINTYIPFSEAIYADNLLHLNDTDLQKNNRIKDKYFKALFLYYNGSTDVEKIILSYLMWGIKVGDLIDVKDFMDNWYVSIALKFSPGQVYIHYVGWGSRWDEWVNILNMDFIGELSNGRFRWTDRYVIGSPDHEKIISKDQINTRIYIHRHKKITLGEITHIENCPNIENCPETEKKIRKITYYDTSQRMMEKISKYVINSYIDEQDKRFIFATITN